MENPLYKCSEQAKCPSGEFKTSLPARPAPHLKQAVAQTGDGALDLATAWTDRGLTCSHCKRCTGNCEVLGDPNLDIGEVSRAYKRIMALPEDQRVAATVEVVQTRFEMYNALRRCCFCGFCTSTCRAHQFAPGVMRGWRELFSKANIMPPGDSRLVMVDNEWDIFSAYRAIYGIGYPEFLDLATVAEEGPGVVDTVFFPGCSLASYTPQLVRAVGEWLNGHGVKWALSTHCCGSPLMSAGLFERAEGLRLRIIDQMRRAGVKRFLTVCPGCGEEFAENMPEDIDIIPLPEYMLQLGNPLGAGTVAQQEPQSPSPQSENTQPANPQGFNPLTTVDSYAVFDSCHDRRDNRHGLAIRQLLARYMPNAQRKELHHRRKLSLCCGAGGAVAGYDDEISARRVGQVLSEGHASGAQSLVTMCPTCAYTIGQANLSAALPMESHHYLEMLFGIETSWPEVFGNLEAMWSGEYGPWLNQTFFS